MNGRFDPRDGDAGLKRFEEEVKRYNLKGVKLYTAEWHGDSKGWKLTDPGSKKYLDKCAELGVVNIHVHKGPTIWPLNKDAFDVGDVDEVATEYLDAGLRFIVEHCGLPRLEDFCRRTSRRRSASTSPWTPSARSSGSTPLPSMTSQSPRRRSFLGHPPRPAKTYPHEPALQAQ